MKAGLLSFSGCGQQSRQIPSYAILCLLLYVGLVWYFVSVVDDFLPSPVSELEAGADSASEERSWRHLVALVGKGPRVAGTKYHLEKTRELKDVLDTISSNASIKVHTDWQIVSGDFWLGSKLPYVNMYNNVSNIIAVLEGESGIEGSSVLFNCHYDSVPTSPGASDNAMFCAVMLEMLTVLSKRSAKFKHNIVFLFNGAEENPLQGSAGFLKHPWCKGVNAFVNLDAAGTNCKGLVFQVTDTRILNAYKSSVRTASAQAFGEVLFSSGLVPSDTDFRIFRDFGEIYGIDIALYKYGSVYHTRYDSLATLRPGVIQHAADSLLALAVTVADDQAFATKGTKSTAVYWDYLNLYMFVYGNFTAFLLDSFAFVIAAFSIYYYHVIVGLRKSMAKELVISLSARLVSALIGCLTLYLVHSFSTVTTTQLRYLSHPWIIVPMYWIPFFVGAVATAHLFDYYREDKCGLNRVRRTAQAQAATKCLLLPFVFIALFLLDATARYIITVPLLYMSLCSLVQLYVISKCQINELQHLVLQVTMATPALIFHLSVADKANHLMLPIMGRSPINEPDFNIAMLNMFLCLIVSIPLSGIELLFSRVDLTKVLLSLLLPCLVVSFLPLSPYNVNGIHPVVQRHTWFHCDVFSYNEKGEQTDRQTGIWFTHTEANIQKAVPILENQLKKRVNVTTDFDQFCGEMTFCNKPMVTPRTIEWKNDSVWVDFEPPTQSKPETKFILERRIWENENCTLEFSLTGPPHMSLTLCPKRNVSLVDWSLASSLQVTGRSHGRPVYFVYVTQGTHSATTQTLHFSFTLKVKNATQSSRPILDIALNAHRMYHPEEFTQAYERLVSQMPDYFNIASHLSTRHNYVF